MITPEYDRTSKPTAPRGSFICPYCGNKVSRRLSKVKNPDRVFCNNTCRGLFTEREKLHENMLCGSDFVTEISHEELKKVASYCIYRAMNKYVSARKYQYDELWQECCIATWKYGKKANNGKGGKYSFYTTCFERAILNFLEKNDWTVEELSLSDFEAVYTQPEGLDIIGKLLLHEIETKAEKKKNWAWFRDYYIDGKSSSAIAEEFGADMREVVCAISYLKKTIRKKYLEAV